MAASVTGLSRHFLTCIYSASSRHSWKQRQLSSRCDNLLHRHRCIDLPTMAAFMTDSPRPQRGETANPATRPLAGFGLWCLAALLALAVHAGGGLLLAQWHPAPVAAAAPVMASIITRRSEPTALPPPVPPTPPVEVKKPPPQAILAARPRPVPAPRSEPTPAAVVPPSPVVAPARSMPVAAPALRAPAMAPAPPVRELAVHCPHRQPPAYPAAARRRGLEGSVQLKVALAASGVIGAITVSESSGSPLLDQAAVSAVRRWRCEPARIDGNAVTALALQRITFHLQ